MLQRVSAEKGSSPVQVCQQGWFAMAASMFEGLPEDTLDRIMGRMLGQHYERSSAGCRLAFSSNRLWYIWRRVNMELAWGLNDEDNTGTIVNPCGTYANEDWCVESRDPTDLQPRASGRAASSACDLRARSPQRRGPSSTPRHASSQARASQLLQRSPQPLGPSTPPAQPASSSTGPLPMGPPRVRISSAQREPSSRPRRTRRLSVGRWRHELPSGSYSVAFQSTASPLCPSAGFVAPFIFIHGALARGYLRQTLRRSRAFASQSYIDAVVARRPVHVTLDHNIRELEVVVPRGHLARVSKRARREASVQPEPESALPHCSHHGAISDATKVLAGRMPYVLDEIERDKAYYDRLLEAYEEAETPDQIARGLRLERHPVWLQCTAQGQRFHLHDKYRLLSKIVYRCDRSSLFASYAPQRGKHDRAVQRIANLKAARARADEAAAGREPISSSLVLRTAAVDHFKETLDHACLYSFSPGAGAAVDVCSLDACLGQPSYLRRVPCGGSASAVQLETDGGDALCTHGPTDETQETLFFRVVHRKPASMKTVRLPAASAGRIASDAMAITVHKAVDAPSGDPFVHTQPSIAGGCGVALFPDLVKFELGTLQNNLLEWTAAGPLQYHFGLLGICDCASEISTVNELVQNKAWPDGEEGVELHSSQDCIADLKHLGHIVRAPRGGYRLTEAGMRALRCARVASDPQPALRLRSHLPLKDRTAYELAMALQDAGFQWRQLPRNTSQREKLAYRVDDASSALEWYTASTHLSRPYLLCLLQAQTLRDSFGTESIPHWHGLGDKAYSRMLEGKPPSSPPRLAVLDDPDVDMLGIEDAPAAGPAVGIDGDIIEQSFEEMLAAIIEEEGIVFPPDPAESPPEAPAIPSEPTHEGLSQVHRDEQIHFDADMRVFCSSLRWGSGKFKWSAADASAPFGSVAAICACHKKNKRTLCVKEVGLRSRDMSHVESVLWALKHWLNQGPEYSRRRFHMLPRRLDLAAVPSPRVVEAQRIADNPPDNVLDDDELDALHGPAVAPVRGSAVASAATRPRPLPDAALDDVLALPAPVRGSAVASAATCPRPLPDAALDDDSGCHSGSTLDHLAPSSMHSGSTLDHLAPSSMSSDSESSD